MNHDLSRYLLSKMRGATSFLILIFSAFVFFCAAVPEENSPFIVGGENARIEEYPYLAGVFMYGIHMCTGSIISSRSVLTV